MYYFEKLKMICDELVVVDDACLYAECVVSYKVVACRVKLKMSQFLLGLNVTFNNVRMNLLMTHPLPCVNFSYSTFVQEKRQRCVVDSLGDNIMDNLMQLYVDKHFVLHVGTSFMPF